jgi:hypothetical protein
LSRGEKGTNPRRALMGSGFESHVRTLTDHETFKKVVKNPLTNHNKKCYHKSSVKELNRKEKIP